MVKEKTLRLSSNGGKGWTLHRPTVFDRDGREVSDVRNMGVRSFGPENVVAISMEMNDQVRLTLARTFLLDFDKTHFSSVARKYEYWAGFAADLAKCLVAADNDTDRVAMLSPEYLLILENRRYFLGKGARGTKEFGKNMLELNDLIELLKRAAKVAQDRNL